MAGNIHPVSLSLLERSAIAGNSPVGETEWSDPRRVWSAGTQTGIWVLSTSKSKYGAQDR